MNGLIIENVGRKADRTMMWMDWHNWLQPAEWLFGGTAGIGRRAIIGAAGGAAAALAALRLRALSRSGAVSAAIMGAGYTALGGLLWFMLLLTFFSTSSLLSKWKRKQRRKSEAESLYEKSGARDGSQVWANGGIGLALCAGNALLPHPGWVYAFVGVMAAVNADTWATEVGALSRVQPFSIRTGKRVPPGTSGGITPLGTAAAAAGAAVIGIAAIILAAVPGALPNNETIDATFAAALLCAAIFGGMAGAVFDSYLGATIQSMFQCRVCKKETERSTHCGSAAIAIRGIPWVNNDAVNMLSSIAAGAAAWGIGRFFG